jgi:hypothetical protein
VEAYAARRNECAGVTEAYCRWCDAAHDEGAARWEAYESALERGERASAATSS